MGAHLSWLLLAPPIWATEQRIPGDVNSDGQVNFADFVIVSDFTILAYHCCPRTVGYSEMKFKKRLQLAILYLSDPVNENRVATSRSLLQRMSF